MYTGEKIVSKSRKLIDVGRCRQEILEEDRTLCLEEGEDVSSYGLRIEDGQGYVNKTPPVEGLLPRCCTPMQQLVATRVVIQGHDPVVVARDLTRQTGDMVHPDDVRLAADIAKDNLRLAYVCELS